MKASILNLQGKVVGKVELPPVFQEPIRPDLIQRAVLAIWSRRRQPYGTDVLAGKRTSAHYHGRRRLRMGVVMMGVEMARLPRIHGKVSPHLLYRARFAPQAVKGRVAHPPKVEKVWAQKLNKKERRKALRSAVAATASREWVSSRGHRIQNVRELPIVVRDEIQSVGKTKEVVEFLRRVGLEEELKRVKAKKVRPGKGKLRGRRYRRKVGPLIVVARDEGIGRAASNIPGVEVRNVKDVCTECLAPGAQPARLVIWSVSALERLHDFFRSQA
jgi:large subunit ribosomal protein L4e